MSIVTVNDFWGREQQKSMDKKQISVRYATVIELTLQGEPIIQFMGESLPSYKTYPRMKHYIPEIGDRVMLINGWIIGGRK